MEVNCVLGRQPALDSESLKKVADVLVRAAQKAEVRYERKTGKQSSSQAYTQPSVL